MLSKWPILVKLLAGSALLLLLVGILAVSGLYAIYAYRALVKSLSWRAVELPLAAELSRRVGDLRITLGELRGLKASGFPGPDSERLPSRLWMIRDQFRAQLAEVQLRLDQYRAQLEQKMQVDWRIADTQQEWQTVHKIEAALAKVDQANQQADWILDDLRVGQLDRELENLQALTAELPSHLHHRLRGFADEVRNQYRVMIVGTWVATLSAAVLLAVFLALIYGWIYVPLRVLIEGSRRVASGEFDYRIQLQTHDEMAELAGALNDMTARFQAIRDDLDRQVQERTRQVVRSEQLASVGFLAAGVAHEINNPLASIALCAESLESRIRETLQLDDEEHGVISQYLRMIQTEAFRCKQITEKLLDFSRAGPPQKQQAELGELVQSVIDVVRHLGKYQRKHIRFEPAGPVVAPVCPAQIKQVALNLLTNALDAVDEGGTVEIRLGTRDGWAELVVQDNGCGMEPEVLQHVFEPFFSRKWSGQGSGLGLSIAHRIVSEHRGEIEADSAGVGRGATFRVRLPLTETNKETEHQRRAA